MSIPQLLSRDPNEDLDYSYPKSQNGSGAYNEDVYGRRAQASTDSADDKDSAATVTDVNLSDIDAKDSRESTDEESNLAPPSRKLSEPKTGLVAVNLLIYDLDFLKVKFTVRN
jgi:hypothetical protein